MPCKVNDFQCFTSSAFFIIFKKRNGHNYFAHHHFLFSINPSSYTHGITAADKLKPKFTVQTPTVAHVTLRRQRWIIYVNIGVLRTNIHDILSEGCLVLLQEGLRPQGSNQTVSPLHKLTSPGFKCSGRGGGKRSRTVFICQLALHEVQGSEWRFGMPWLRCRYAAGEWMGT